MYWYYRVQLLPELVSDRDVNIVFCIPTSNPMETKIADAYRGHKVMTLWPR